MSFAASLAHRRALAALLDAPAAARGMAIVGRGGGRSGGSGKEVAPLAPTWRAVTDKHSGLTYWWNERTGQTTAVGAPRPEGEYLPAVQEAVPRGAPQSATRTVAELVAWGAGVTFAIAAVRAVIG